MEPTHFLNYRGDKRSMRNHVGPTWDGHILVPVDAEYDPEMDRTRVGFVTLASVQNESSSS